MSKIETIKIEETSKIEKIIETIIIKNEIIILETIIKIELIMVTLIEKEDHLMKKVLIKILKISWQQKLLKKKLKETLQVEQ